jgi:uncharacterized protein with HEPN domain
LLAGKSLQQAGSDVVVRAAFERFLEIISEPSRHLPDGWKMQFGAQVPWRQVADLGNVLRHAYEQASFKALWSIYQHDLDPLSLAVDAMLLAYDTDGEFAP